jgi:selenocysteine lyase/cysteine desulfurase
VNKKIRDLKQYRKLFLTTKYYTYLNHAGTGPLPTTAVKAIEQLSRRYSEQGSIEWDEYEKLSGDTRDLAAKMVNATSDEICFIQNTSQGIIYAIGSISWEKGDNVILMKDAFPTNSYPYLFLLPEVEKRFITSFELISDLDSLLKLIDNRTKAIALDWVNFLNGIRIDLAAIGQICQDKDIFFIVDGMQGLGAITLDLKKIHVDFFSSAAPKWLLGPHGIGMLYVKRETLSRLKPFNLGWLSADWPDFYDIFTPKPLKTSAARFEEGTKNYLGIVGFQECLKLFHEIGLDNVGSQVLDITDYFLSKINDLRFEIITPKARDKRAGIVSFRRKDKDSMELFMKLKQKKIVCSLREGYIRISPHFYNTIEELDHLIKIIR